VCSSSDHVVHAGQKYTISSPTGRGMSVDYKSVFRLAISHIVLEKWVKKSENREIWAKFEPPPHKFFGGAPKILKPVSGTPFQGLFPGEVWTTPPDPKRVGKNFAPKFLLGGEGPPRGT